MKKLYDSKHCLVNVSNSLLKHYNIKTNHVTECDLDKVLEKNKGKKICLMLLDGLGSAIQDCYADDCKYLRSGFFKKITSVFPPTTVAATTSLLSSLYPCETGWLGWTGQFEDDKRAVVMFASAYDDGSLQAANINSYIRFPYQSIIEKMRLKGISSTQLMSFMLNDKSTESFFEETKKRIDSNDFVYSYYTEPDSLLHQYGVGSKEVKNKIKEIDGCLEKLVSEYKDVLFIVVADHGHLNAKSYQIEEHKDFYDTLKIKHYSIEPRAAAFFVKEDKKEEFEKLANKYYGDHFYILSKEEVIKEKIFGDGQFKSSALYCLGDYLLISKDESVFNFDNRACLLSHHAGSSDDEKYINISVFNSL